MQLVKIGVQNFVKVHRRDRTNRPNNPELTCLTLPINKKRIVSTKNNGRSPENFAFAEEN